MPAKLGIFDFYLISTMFVPGIEIHRDRSNVVLGLSQKAHLEKILHKYNMHASKHMPAPIIKCHRFGKFYSPKNLYEKDSMKAVPYTSAVKRLQYARVYYICPRSYFAFVTGVLERYQ